MVDPSDIVRIAQVRLIFPFFQLNPADGHEANGRRMEAALAAVGIAIHYFEGASWFEDDSSRGVLRGEWPYTLKDGSRGVYEDRSFCMFIDVDLRRTDEKDVLRRLKRIERRAKAVYEQWGVEQQSIYMSIQHGLVAVTDYLGT